MPFVDGKFQIPNNLVQQYLAGQKKANPTPIDANFSDVAAGLTQIYGSSLNVGDIIPSAILNRPGLLPCNGGLLSKTAEATLYAVIGDKYNVGNVPADKFMLPNIAPAVGRATYQWGDSGSGTVAWDVVAINTSNDDVWAAGGGNVKLLRGGSGAWETIATGQGNIDALAINPNTGDVFISSSLPSSNILVLRGGVGTFTSTGLATRAKIALNPTTGDVWAFSILAPYNISVLRGGVGAWQSAGTAGSAPKPSINPITGDVWVSYGGTVKVLRGGIGTTWADTTSGGAGAIDVDYNSGDVWLAYNSVVKVLIGGAGSWTTVAAPLTSSILSMAINKFNGDIWVAGSAATGEVNVLRGGSGTWQAVNSGQASWASLAVNQLSGDVWAAPGGVGGAIKVLRNNAVPFYIKAS